MAYTPPLAGGYTQSSGFGQRSGTLHAGVDYAAPAGTTVRAALPGTVITSGFSSGGWGNQVVIDHGIVNGQHLYTRYAHLLSAPSVGLNATVTAGQTIGQVGSTGDSTGNHLHFGTYVGTTDNAGARDPSTLLGALTTGAGVSGLINGSPDAVGVDPASFGLIPAAAMALLERITAAFEKVGATAKVAEGLATTATKLFLPTNLVRVAAGVLAVFTLCFSLWFLGRELMPTNG